MSVAKRGVCHRSLNKLKLSLTTHPFLATQQVFRGLHSLPHLILFMLIISPTAIICSSFNQDSFDALKSSSDLKSSESGIGGVGGGLIAGGKAGGGGLVAGGATGHKSGAAAFKAGKAGAGGFAAGGAAGAGAFAGGAGAKGAGG